jgi:coenzyme F420-0:L-glutamate ligase/coenzyme F420-1:gamma-L-glutamate ligase
VVLTEAAAKYHLAESMGAEFRRDLEKDNLPGEKIDLRVNKSRERITSAPVVIILCLDMSEMDSYPDETRKKAEHLIATQSAANAGMQLLLAAHAEGLGGVWVCSPMFAQEIVQTALNISNHWEPQAMFLIGYPVEIPEVRARKELKEVVHFVTVDDGLSHRQNQ